MHTSPTIYPNYFYGKTVLITGANSGLGEALALKASQYGAKVIMTGRNMMGLEIAHQKIITFLQQINSIPFPPIISLLNISDPKSIDSFKREYLNLFDGQAPDIVINNAGISYRGEIFQTEASVDRLLMETNYFGPIELVKAFLPHMIKRKSGVIINIGSLQGKISIPYRSAYSSSKHALQAFTDCLRAEVNRHNIAVYLVSPGYMNTKLSLNAMNPDASLYNKLDKNTAQGLDTLKVAEKILMNLVYKKKPELIIASFKHKMALYVRCLWPNLFFILMNQRAKHRFSFLS